MGPILEEFRKNRHELGEQLRAAYYQALTRAGRPLPARAPEIRVTVQGGIGTAEEDRMLRDCYGVEGTGWGTPFLLVPEATSVDPEHLVKLAAATEEDVYLSECSPIDADLTLRNSASENMRRGAIARGAGSPCSKGHAKLYNTEFTEEPICTASRQYQRMKAQLAKEDLGGTAGTTRQSVLAKACICHDLPEERPSTASTWLQRRRSAWPEHRQLLEDRHARRDGRAHLRTAVAVGQSQPPAHVLEGTRPLH